MTPGETLELVKAKPRKLEVSGHTDAVAGQRLQVHTDIGFEPRLLRRTASTLVGERPRAHHAGPPCDGRRHPFGDLLVLCHMPRL